MINALLKDNFSSMYEKDVALKQGIFFFFFLSGFSFTNVHDSRDSRGRGRVSI